VGFPSVGKVVTRDDKGREPKNDALLKPGAVIDATLGINTGAAAVGKADGGVSVGKKVVIVSYE